MIPLAIASKVIRYQPYSQQAITLSVPVIAFQDLQARVDSVQRITREMNCSSLQESLCAALLLALIDDRIKIQLAENRKRYVPTKK